MTATHFFRPGVNPTSMDRNLSGDTLLDLMTPSSGHVYAVFDGAWIGGFDALEDADPCFENDKWASETAARLFAQIILATGPNADLKHVLKDTVKLYQHEAKLLRDKAGFIFHPPETLRHVSIEKVMPQCGGAIALIRPDGQIDIAQWCDCFIAIEYSDKSVGIITPDQVVSVFNATRDSQGKPETPNTYQPLVKSTLENGCTYGSIREQIHTMARAIHAPDYLSLFLQTDAILPDDLTGADGFAIWRKTLENVRQIYNCGTFMNNPQAPLMIADNGDTISTSWAMMTGEADMLPLITYRTITPEDAKNIKSLYVASDGTLGSDSAFVDGSRNSAMQKLHAMGAEDYYSYVLNSQFYDEADEVAGQDLKNRRKRFAIDRIPMDVSIIKITL